MKGLLSEGALPGVLRDVYVGRRSGRLHFSRGDQRYSVRLLERLETLLRKRGSFNAGCLRWRSPLPCRSSHLPYSSSGRPVRQVDRH